MKRINNLDCVSDMGQVLDFDEEVFSSKKIQVLEEEELEETEEGEQKAKRHHGIELDDRQTLNYTPAPVGQTRGVLNRSTALSLEEFYLQHFAPQKPVVLEKLAINWPAYSRWREVDYLLSKARYRTVPIEVLHQMRRRISYRDDLEIYALESVTWQVGSTYLSSSWRQELMYFDDYLVTHVLQNPASKKRLNLDGIRVDNKTNRGEEVHEQDTKHYLAQHLLFSQIPALESDILDPVYTSLSDESEDESRVVKNSWFGPAGTVTPIHYDPDHNILVQVVGYKYIRLYDPNSASGLYPFTIGQGFGSEMLTNSSQVDLDNWNSEVHPNFGTLTYYEVILAPGDAIYIPPKWWHYAKSLSISFSVSFWWK